MRKNRTKSAIIAGAAVAALALPATAGAANADPFHGFGGTSVSASAKFTPEVRQEIRAAKREFRQAVRAAWRTFEADTADERATRRAAITAAETTEERQAARQAFRADIADEKAIFKDARSTAREAKKAAIAAAKA
ncbi:MAG: hypothetical protein HQ526_08410 [Actinobacteria bacterium]|nr:hypothetical protein [Actinomycetota bacterium]